MVQRSPVLFTENLVKQYGSFTAGQGPNFSRMPYPKLPINILP
jgi:hypothetical protein